LIKLQLKIYLKINTYTYIYILFNRIKNSLKKKGDTRQTPPSLLDQIETNVYKHLTTSEDGPQRSREVFTDVQNQHRRQRTEILKKYTETRSRQQKRAKKHQRQEKKFWKTYLKLIQQDIKVRENTAQALIQLLNKD
jgi:hypothetical protein